MSTPHEAVTKAIETAELAVSRYPDEVPAYEDMATAAIEALREGAAQAVQQAYNADMGDTISIETAKILVDAVLGPPKQ